jgi:hypothetical protein
MSQAPRPLSEVSGKRKRCVRRDEKEAEINHADSPTEAPESKSDECEAHNTQQPMCHLSGDSAKELAFAEKHESGDRPNNQRAADHQYHHYPRGQD